MSENEISPDKLMEGVIRQIYRGLLGREADPGGLENWTAEAVRSGDLQVVINGIKESIEYQQLCNAQLIKSDKQRLIRDLLAKADCRSPYYRKRLLVWEPSGIPPLLNRAATFATALRMWGAEAQLVICDGAPIACVRREVLSEPLPFFWSKRCPGCLRESASEASSFNLPCNSIGEFVSEERRSELHVLAHGVPAHQLATFRYREVEVGKLAVSSSIRYFKGLPGKGREDISREYLYAGLVYTEAAITAIERFKPDFLLMSHGCYVDYGAALSVARDAGIPVVLWHFSYLEHHIYMKTHLQGSNWDIHMLSEDAWQQRREHALSEQEDGRLESYLNARYTTDAAADVKLPGQPLAMDELRKKLDIPFNKPVWCIFTHLNWDDVFAFNSQMAFDTPELWLIDTIRTVIAHPDITWLIKVHPAEINTGTVYSVKSIIEEHFPELPPHVRVIPADSDINAYGLYLIADGGVTVFGTPGLELAILGKPVILAGDGHYGGKGFTYDGLTKEDYMAFLNRAEHLPKLSALQQALARQYAYSYFIQHQIPLKMVGKGYSGLGQLDYRELDLLLPGKDKAMTMICERVLGGGDFIMDEDMVAFYSALR